MASDPMPADTQVRAGGVTLNVQSAGEGETLVLLHEIGGTLHSFDAVMPALAKRFRVIAYDQRGCGQSQKITGEFTLDTLVADLRTLIAALGLRGPVHLCGVAVGAALAVRYAASFPRDVRSLVLACPALSVSEERKDYLTRRAAAVIADGMAATADASLANSYPPEIRRDAAAFEAYRTRFLASDPASYAAINTAFTHFDAAQDLAQLRCPVLVLAGLHDRLRPPEQVREIVARILNAQYDAIDCGHVMPVQAPSEMAAAILAFHKSVS